MDKRSNPRYAILLSALVHPTAGRSWLCSIQDFCSGGMLLVEQQTGRGRRALPGIEAGATVGIHFSVPGKIKDQHFRLEGKIVRVMDSGVGIRFAEGVDDDAMTALLNHASSNSAPPKAAPRPPAPSSAAAPKSVPRSAPVSSPVSSAAAVSPAGAKPAQSTPVAASPVPASQQTATGASAAAKAGVAGTPQAARQNSSAKPATPTAATRQTRAASVAASTPAVRPPGPITKEEAKRLIASIRSVVAKVLPEMNSAFFSYMDDELLRLARDAKSNAVQSEFFAAMSNLEKAKKEVGQSFNNEVLDQLDRPRELEVLLAERKAAELERKTSQASKTKLSLVDTDDFEDWLAIANIISRSERVYEKYLQDIRRRLGMLMDSWAHKDANPLGTTTFCHAFDHAIRRVELSKDIRQKVYVGFESKAIPLFRKLYVAVTKLLDDSQLFPDVDEDFITPTVPLVSETKPVAKPTPPVDVPEVSAEPEPVAEPKPAAEAGPGSEKNSKPAPPREQDRPDFEANPNPSPADIRAELQDLRAELRQQRSHVPSYQEDPLGRQLPGGGMRQRPADRRVRGREESPRALGDIYSTVRNLLAKPEQGLEGEEPHQDYLEADELQQLLRSIRPSGNGQQRLNVREQVRQQVAADSGRRLAPAALESLDVVENLVDTIEQDVLLSGSAKGWIRQLELTLGKVAADQNDLLDDENPHRALDVINQLARLGGSESGSMRREVDQIVEQINSNYDGDPEVFDAALSQLEPLVARQSRAFTGNIQRTVKASEGQQTLLSAQRAVVGELDQRLVGRQVPEVLMKLLMPGWRNLMVNTHLRQGQDSSDWQRQVRTLDQVVQHLDGSADPASGADYIAPEDLLAEIEQGLDSISFEPGLRAPLIKNLRELIVDRRGLEQMPMMAVNEATVASSLGFGEVGEREARRQQIVQTQAPNRNWQQCLERARRLHIGEWLDFKEEKEDNRIAIVAWANTEHSAYVFVNRRGVKTLDLMVEELANKLLDGSASILEEADIPLSDRASHQMLQNMHNQLTHQASHDEVTGLVNRKEFERALTRALELAKRDKTNHLVAYFDLDQFKVINNAVGHEAGDKLLNEIAVVLTTALSGYVCVLSRLGGDEYGLLVENCEKDKALELVKVLCKVIKDYSFNAADTVFRLTASCGVMFVDEEVTSVQSILQCADAACFAAKDAGRDRVHVYQADDSAMEHRRDVMDFVSQIDKALEEDRFILNCQLITPIDPDGDDHDHYEILLTVLDEDNNPMPPQDFIVAAETYNRMGAIDRWVIKNSFDFIAKNILHFTDLGAFSINISGNSLTEEDFMEFVLEQFRRTRVPTSKICFEITETSAVGSLDDAIEFIEKLQIIGVQFSLDDFGTGLSSYSYLRSLPVDYLKIDGIFVKDLQTNPNDYAVVKSINEIGHFMGKKTIAEYVENDEVLAILREIGVDFAQGFGVGKKKPITELLLG
jgi:diguanylate cyclase (GGDEF)-like protein